jgi:hypothetical protein
MAALKALPAEGGIVDASDFHGVQEWSTSIVITKPVTMKLPCARIISTGASLVIGITKGQGFLSGVEVAGCGAATELVVGKGSATTLRLIRVLGNYSPPLAFPPVGTVASGDIMAGSSVVQAIENLHPKVDGFVESARIADAITLTGVGVDSVNGMRADIVGRHGKELTLSRPVSVTRKSVRLRLTIGGYRLPATLGSIAQGSNRLNVEKTGLFSVGDAVRVPGAGPMGREMVAQIARADGTVLVLRDRASRSVAKAIVRYAIIAGQATIRAEKPDDLQDLRRGDWILIGEWMNYSADNGDWARMEWKKVKDIEGTKVNLVEPLRVSYGDPTHIKALGYPVFWRRVTGLVERVHIHDIAISDATGAPRSIGIEAQNGRHLEVDHVSLNLRNGLGFETVSQQAANIHDNLCESAQCADFGGLTDSIVANNIFHSIGKAHAAALELGSARNVIIDNQFLNADSERRNPYVTGIGGASIDSNVIEGNYLSATPRASCILILGGIDNAIRNNLCTGGVVGILLQDWPGPDPARPAARNVVECNVIYDAEISIALIASQQGLAYGDLNVVARNSVDTPVRYDLNTAGRSAKNGRARIGAFTEGCEGMSRQR